MQASISFELVLPVEGSFATFLSEKKTQEDQMKIKTMVEQNLSSFGGYNDFFNFGLNTTTWRLFVNKQILMKYERLFIEKQMNEVRTKRNDLER